MARRIMNRKDLRAAAEAAERQKNDTEEHDEEEEEEEEEDEEEEEGEEKEAATDEDEEGAEVAEEEVEVKPKKKKKAAPVAKAKPRSRTAKVVRLKVVWGVFNNSHQCVKTFEYPRRKEAEDHAAHLTSDKRSTHFVQPVKEPIEEKKEK